MLFGSFTFNLIGVQAVLRLGHSLATARSRAKSRTEAIHFHLEVFYRALVVSAL